MCLCICLLCLSVTVLCLRVRAGDRAKNRLKFLPAELQRWCETRPTPVLPACRCRPHISLNEYYRALTGSPKDSNGLLHIRGAEKSGRTPLPTVMGVHSPRRHYRCFVVVWGGKALVPRADEGMADRVASKSTLPGNFPSNIHGSQKTCTNNAKPC